jgi:hypothetical protein
MRSRNGKRHWERKPGRRAQTADKITKARSSCRAGNDRAATLMALELWDAFVDEERQDGTLSMNSHLTILELRIERLKAFSQRGWKAAMSDDEERRFQTEIDRLDAVLAETLRRALR